jgi:hypothetical protein
MKKLIAVLMTAIAVTLICGGCAIIDDMDKSRHEQNSTPAVIDVSLDKLVPAIEAGAKKAGFVVKKVRDTGADGTFEGEGITITYSKLSNGQCRIYVRCGFTGDRDKEALVIKEIRTALGIKKDEKRTY